MRTDAILSGRTLLILGVGIALISCRMSGEVIAEHESIAGGKIYTRVMIVARSADQAFRTEAEDTFRDVLEDTRTDSSISVNIFEPTRCYAEAEIRRMLSERAIEGVVIFRSIRSVHDSGIHAKKHAQIVDAINYAGHSDKRKGPDGDYEVSLVDVQTGKTIWIYPASVRRPGPSTPRETVYPIAVRSIELLQEAGMLLPEKKAKWYNSNRR